MSKLSLIDQLEALLFVANDPLTIERLAALTSSTEAEVATALTELGQRLGEGLQLMQHEGTYRLVTAPAADTVVRQYLEAETRTELSRPALETLAIIAYRGPLTKAQLDELRGVASDAMLRNLLQRGLISEQGPAKAPGRPMRYGVSHAFLEHFGLSSLAELPPLEEPKA
ncbi:MAG TPA: SMC-Scp complex subunit ScpB [Candidatus Saccharimonas sp.]|nr:SMC-Scp complex subunit ScpB [Candidatus Saccharimonas sp.]